MFPVVVLAGGLGTRVSRLTKTALPKVMLAQFVAKVGVEVVFTPVTYWVVGALKRAEHEDYYDRDTRFTPFTLKV